MAIRPIRWPGLAFVSMAAAMVMVPTVSSALEAQITRTRYGIPHHSREHQAGSGIAGQVNWVRGIHQFENNGCTSEA